jgi:hypothetical protein
MFYPELKQLQKANPDQAKVISALDGYLASLHGSARSHINATTVAQGVGAPRDKVIGLLMGAATLGLLKLKFRVMCPHNDAGIKDYDKLSDIPREVYCDVCDEAHKVTPDDIEYFFELSSQGVPVRA